MYIERCPGREGMYIGGALIGRVYISWQGGYVYRRCPNREGMYIGGALIGMVWCPDSCSVVAIGYGIIIS